MDNVIVLPSGLKPSKEWKPTKEEFYKTLELHLRMEPKDRRKSLIDADWKVYSKTMKPDKPKGKKEESPI